MYYKNRELTLVVRPAIQEQIDAIVRHFNSEVSWFGDITIDEETDTIFIDKIYLFPQVVTGGSFRTDNPEVSDLYDEWYSNKLDEMMDEAEAEGRDPKPIMQYNGHSHLNAPCTASSEDMRFRHSREGINVYSIHNKKGDMDWEVWTDDIIWEVEDINIVRHVEDISGTLVNAKEYVMSPKVKTYGYNANNHASKSVSTVSHKTGLAGDQRPIKADEKKNTQATSTTTSAGSEDKGNKNKENSNPNGFTPEELEDIERATEHEFDELRKELGYGDDDFLDDYQLAAIEKGRAIHGYGGYYHGGQWY